MTPETPERIAIREANVAGVRKKVRIVKQASKNLSRGMDRDLAKIVKQVAQIIFECLNDKENEEKQKMAMGWIKLFNDSRRLVNQSAHQALETEKWEFEVARTCHGHFQELQKILGQNDLNEDERVERFRQRLFGGKPSPQGI